MIVIASKITPAALRQAQAERYGFPLMVSVSNHHGEPFGHAQDRLVEPQRDDFGLAPSE